MSQTLQHGSDCEIRQMWRQINVFQRGHWLNRSFRTNGVVFHLLLMWFLPDSWCRAWIGQIQPWVWERIGGSALVAEPGG